LLPYKKSSLYFFRQEICIVKKSLILGALLLALSSIASANKKKVVPEAPVPDFIVKAHNIFVTNGGGNQLAFDEFYSQVKTWERYHLVGSPSEAEVIMELKYFVIDQGPHVWSSTNSYTGQTQVHSTEMTDPQLQVNIYDAKTKDLLWSVTDHRRLARLEKNREKESINSADRLAAGLRERVEASPSPSPARVTTSPPS
jgi:hypothetical protein